MNLLDQLAEANIEEAIERGLLDDLRGMGSPLELDDDSMVPDDLRAAYRILRNSGHLPQDVTIYTEIRNVESLIGRMEPGGERAAQVKRLSLLRTKLGNERCVDLSLRADYYEAVMDKLGKR